MTAELLLAQIKGMETQLALLKAQVKRLNASTPPRTLGDLEGILAGHGDFSDEEIDSVLYQSKWIDEAADAAE